MRGELVCDGVTVDSRVVSIFLSTPSSRRRRRRFVLLLPSCSFHTLLSARSNYRLACADWSLLTPQSSRIIRQCVASRREIAWNQSQFRVKISGLFCMSDTLRTGLHEQAVREAATIYPSPCKLTLQVNVSRYLWRGLQLPILVFLGLSVLDLGPMYAIDRQTDRQTSDAHHRLMPPP